MKLKILTALLILGSQMVQAQDWIQLNDLPETFLHRHHPVAFSLNGYGYILTGDTFIDEAKDFFKYDPLSDTWEQLDDFPGEKRSFAYGVTTQDRAYVGFGSYSMVVNDPQIPLKDWWEYHQVTNEWTELTSCPCLARQHPAMIALDDKIFVGLGSGGPQTGPQGEDFGGDMNDWWEYDIPSDTWTQKPDFPGIWRHHPYFFGIDGIAYVGMGHHHSNIGNGGVYNDLYKYDPASETWMQVASLPTQGRVAGAQFTYNGKGYVLSGEGETHQNLPTGEFWEYDPVLDSWTEFTPHPGVGRWAPGSFIIDTKLYFTCGYSGTNPIPKIADLWMYDLGNITSIKSISNDLHVNIFPNPTSGLLNIETDKEYETILFYDLLGNQIVNGPFSKTPFDMSALETGVYIVKLSNNNGEVFTKKLIKR